MSNDFRGVILSLKAWHYYCKSYMVSRRRSEVSHAKTSLWAKVQTEDGKVVDVWILKEHGNGKRVRTQELELEAKHQDLIGKTILFTVSRRSGIRFFDRLAETQLTIQPDPV